MSRRPVRDSRDLASVAALLLATFALLGLWP
jgi:hypothetical protein